MLACLMRWLLRMRRYGVTPNAVSYNLVIGLCEQQGDAAAAGRLRRRMQAEGVTPQPKYAPA